MTTTMRRPSIHEVLLHCAYAFASRSTCPTTHVGCVLARDGRILSSGYNGAPAGLPHCDHPVASGDPSRSTCETATHDVANAIAYAARNGVATAGATAYVTVTPCLACAKLLIPAGIKDVYALEVYRNLAGTLLLEQAGIPTVILEV